MSLKDFEHGKNMLIYACQNDKEKFVGSMKGIGTSDIKKNSPVGMTQHRPMIQEVAV